MYGISIIYIDPDQGGIGEIFPEVMIFPEGFNARGKYHH